MTELSSQRGMYRVIRERTLWVMISPAYQKLGCCIFIEAGCTYPEVSALAVVKVIFADDKKCFMLLFTATIAKSNQIVIIYEGYKEQCLEGEVMIQFWGVKLMAVAD